MEKHVNDIFIFLLICEWIRQLIVIKGQCVPVKEELYSAHPLFGNNVTDSGT